MAKKKIHTTDFRDRIRRLQVGQTIWFPLEKESVIRSTASFVNFVYKTKCRVRVDHELGCLVVERSK